jgi:hypothetical protein
MTAVHGAREGHAEAGRGWLKRAGPVKGAGGGTVTRWTWRRMLQHGTACASDRVGMAIKRAGAKQMPGPKLLHSARDTVRDGGGETKERALARVRRLRSAGLVGRRALLAASALAPRRMRSPRLSPCARLFLDAPGCRRPAVVVAFLLDDITVAFSAAVTRLRSLCSPRPPAASSPTRAGTPQMPPVSRWNPIP